ncbi:MAG: hypothetical protein RIS47_638 [Bacteroidota bacterium]
MAFHFRFTSLVQLFLINIILLNLATGCNGSSTAEENQVTTLTFVGDLLLDRGVRERIEHLGIDSLWGSEIDSVFRSSKFVCANLECPATKIQAPINKRFIFRAEPEYLVFLKTHGITHLNLANNHSMDQGRDGLTDTYINIQTTCMIPVGYGNNAQEACHEQLLTIEPRHIYLISSVLVGSENWPYLEDRPCVCEAGLAQISEQVRLLRKEQPNAFIILQLHWGLEHTLKPNPQQIQQAHEAIDAGADCIIGHHTHTVQTTEIYHGKPIFYSIGNFVFDQTKPINTHGLMVKLHISKQSLTFDTIPIQIEQSRPRIIPSPHKPTPEK